jgi:hypothetical protein
VGTRSIRTDISAFGRRLVGLEIEVDAMKAKFGFTLWVIMLLSLAGVSSAEQLVRAGYPEFAAPLTSLPGFTPGATLDNGGLDPSRVEGALIDLMNAVAKRRAL